MKSPEYDSYFSDDSVIFLCKSIDYFRKLLCYFQITHFFCDAEREVRIFVQAEP